MILMKSGIDPSGKKSKSSLRSSDQVSIKYFDSVWNAFDRASAATGRRDFFYNIGGRSVRLCFAGSALIPPLTQAFDHCLVKDESSPDLTVFLWDSESTGISMPAPPWEVDKIVARKEVWRFLTDRIKINYQPENHIYNLLDMSRNTAIYRIKDADRIPQYEKGSPLLQILHWWMSGQDRYLVHAGAVGYADRGALLVGKGGSGKSTTALACLNSNLIYGGDDYCLMGYEKHPNIYTLYSSGKIKSSDKGRFPFLNKTMFELDDLESGKSLIFISKIFPNRISKGFPVRVIFIPVIANAPVTKVQQVSPAVAFRAVAPSTIFQLAGAHKPHFRFLSQVVKSVRCYLLKLGTELPTIPAAIQKVLSED